jgi:NAD(P)-dependent dehydrogenase (short-subunit alcohol dehydrogenase family)
MAKKIALVTGANRGIGREVCVQLAALDYTVLLTARDRAKAEAAARAAGGDVHALGLDVASDDSVRRAAGEAADRFGRVDVLVNNAGIHYDTYETNVLGAWRCAQAFAPSMRARRWGRIVNVSSQVGGAQRAHPRARRRAPRHGRARQLRLPRLGRDRHGRRRQASRRGRRRERGLGGHAPRRRTDGRLLSRPAAARLVASKVS